MTLSALGKPWRFKPNEKKPNTDIDNRIGGDKIDDKNVNLLSKTKKISSKVGFFTFESKLAFTQLKNAFIKVPILYHFDSERYILIEIDASGYIIDGVLSQVISGTRVSNNPQI